ncbi:MAG: DUF3810 family protein [Saprospiraceae bacterium]|nr:DUF3810 family protein [Saprospiraceae bacterium]MCB9319229.1 DUF3810 family protein [Lewinellaceae bacterium]
MKRLSVIAGTGIGLALLSQLLYYFCARHPEWTLQWYYAGLFPWIRRFLSGLLGWIPVPFLYLMLLLVLAWLFWGGRLIWRTTTAWWIKSLRLLFQIAGVAGYVITCFYWFWGFNYATPSVRQRLQLETQAMPDTAISAEFRWITDSLYAYTDSLPVVQHREKGFMEQDGWIREMNAAVKQTLNLLGWPCPGEIPVRRIWPDGALLRIETAGFYLPLTGEAHFDAGMYPLQWPYVVAHELFHAYGITDEGDCNFLALLTCWHSDNPVFKYSALMAYWRQVAPEYRRFHKEEFATLMDSLPASVRTDLESIHRYLDRYPDLFPKMRHAVYNSYLKAHGIREGMASYNEVITLLAAWKQEYGVPFIPGAATADKPD